MAQDTKDTLNAIQTLRFLPESERTEYYDSVVAPLIERAASSVRADLNPENLESWLYIQSSTMDFAIEGITDVTYYLLQQFPRDLERVVTLLPDTEQARIERLLREFQGQENMSAEIVEREEASTSERISRLVEVLDNRSRLNSGVLGEFVGANTIQSSRGFPIIRGTFTIFARNGEEAGSYNTTTGGGSRSYRTTNGPLPPGVFLVSNHRQNRTTAGMVLHEIGYSFDVDPTDGTPVFGRSLFRIHPDGGNEGTNGCLGVRETAGRLRECETQIAELLESGPFKIMVRH